MQKPTGFYLLLSSFLVVIVLLAGSYFLPWKNITWGKLQLLPADTVTVIGEAKSQQRSQVARFTAGVSAVNDDKQAAINEVNRKVEAIIAAVKEFGIKSEDIKTQSLNVFQRQETYYEEGRQKSRPGQWDVGNSIEVTLRDVDRASALASVLTRSGATNIYGPNFSLEDTTEAQNALIDEAMKNARQKAELIAQAAGRKIRRVVSAAEGGVSAQPPVVLRMEGGGGGGGVEPGTGTVHKTVTVVFELE
ncbi:MAG: SIMPL domain-containing protein [Patescibacteria group bacterium]